MAPSFTRAVGSKGSGNGQFSYPMGFTIKSGNIWVADTYNNRVQKLNSKGEYLSQFGSKGSGNGQFTGPSGIAIDNSGNVWVTDSGNNRVEKFNSKGEYLSQFGSEGSGNGQFENPTEIAVDSAGNLWVADNYGNRVEKFNAKGEYLSQFGSQESGNGQFTGPSGIAIDLEGNLWVVDEGSGVQKFNAKGEYLSQFGSGGSGNGQFSSPTGIALDSSSNLWVADTGNNRAEEFNAKGEYLSQFGSGGSGNGQFSNPRGIAIDPEGNLWVLDTYNNRLEEFSQPPKPLATTKAATGVTVSAATLNATVNPEGSATTYYFEYGTTTSYGSKAPIPAAAAGAGSAGVEVSQAIGGLAQGTTYHYRVTAESAAGTSRGEDQALKTLSLPLATTKAATAVTATTATLNASVNPEGSATTYYFEYGTTTSYGSKVPVPAAGAGAGNAGVEVSQAIGGLALDTVYHYRVTAESAVGASHGADKLLTSAGTTLRLSRSFGSEGYANGQFFEPGGIMVDGSGNLWVVDTYNNRVQKFNSKGEYLSQFGSEGSGNGQLYEPSGIAIDNSGDVWLTDFGNNRVEKFNAKGEYLSQFGFGGSGNGQFWGPSGIAAKSGNLWVVDTYNDRVQKFNAKGEYLSQFGSEGSGNGQFLNPKGIAVDPEGNLWVVDQGNNRVEEFSAGGEYLSQFGSAGYNENQFQSPRGIAVGPLGNLWVTDEGNNSVEKFDSTGQYLAALSFPEFYGPSGIAFDAEGDIWVTDSYANRVSKFSPARKPTATTKAATSIKADAATLQGSVNPEGRSTTYQFEYGPTASYGSVVPASPKAIGSASDDVAVSEAVEGFEEGATYHYRVVAKNELGTTQGSDITFTAPRLPEVDTETAVGIEGDQAVLNGTVDPNGISTEYTFEYGPTSTYGTTIAPDGAGDGNTTVEATEAIANLEPETTYHYRIVGSSQAGSDSGEDRTFTTGATASSGSTAIPGDFFGMMWTGDFGQTGYPHVLSAVKNSGARVLRIVLARGQTLQPKYEEIFRYASHRGITILPYLGQGPWPTSLEEQDEWRKFAKNMVEKYGPGGSFWNGSGHPITTWEIWNEPNLKSNSPITQVKDPRDPYEWIAAEEFGNLFHKMSAGLKEGAKGNIEVLAPGLFSFGTSNCDGNECHLSPANFLGQMDHTDDYEGVSLHPYVFKVKGSSSEPHAPTGAHQVEEVEEKVENYIRNVRQKLIGLSEGNKKIWVTELGFPVKNENGDTATFPPVTEAVQREEVEATFGMMKAKHDSLGIAHAFYYHIQDARCSQWQHETYGCDIGEEGKKWDSHSGLRKGGGGNRPAWKGYASVTPKGHPDWSAAKQATGSSTGTPFALSVSPTYNVETQGARYEARLEWDGGPLSSTYSRATSWQTVEAQDEGEGDNEPVNVQNTSTISGLQPETTYHYRVAVRNENGEVETEPSGHQFQTKPLVSASIRTLNGEPGWVNVNGHVNGATSLNNTWVNINFRKKEGGQYVFKPEESTHAELYNGDYSLVNWRIGHGEWEVNVVFPGEGSTPSGETGLEAFTIKNGYQLVAQHSGKCLDVSDESYASGATMHQWECLGAATQQNQVFTIRPKDASHFELVARHSGKCVDVQNASQEVGATIQQWDCNGTGAQSWWIGPAYPEPGLSEYVNVVNQNSGQCMDVSGGSTANGAPIHQWPCLGTNQANQIWRLKSVESGPVRTETTVSYGNVLHGQPGYVTISGYLKAGAYSMNNRIVHALLEKETSPGVWSLINDVPMGVNSEGHYEWQDFGLSPGRWLLRSRFVGGEDFAESASGEHQFYVHQGFRFVSQRSNKCLSLSNGNNQNYSGQPIIQWDCSSNNSIGDGQIYQFVPRGGGWYNLKVMQPSGQPERCVDVAGASSENGATLVQHDCNGGSNESWTRAAPSSFWWTIRVQQTGKCLDDLGGSLNNGTAIGVWDCAGNANQNWDTQWWGN
jgi:sugar lactone lactonase YvrE